MENDILKKVRRIEIKARGLSHQMFGGEYQSVFKGHGMAFSEVREYQYGDDVRDIDWNVTARLHHPYVKIYEEERELTVMLLVDVSGSNRFGTHSQFKEELVAEVAATLAFSAIESNDKVGVILFSDRIEKYIPPQKGTKHILRIIRELISYTPLSQGTDIGNALRYFTNVVKKRCTAFLLSDCFDTGFEEPLKIAARKHDMAVLRICDRNERQLPDIGLVKMYDPENGATRWVDTSSALAQAHYAERYTELQRQTDEMLRRHNIDSADLYTGNDFVKPLMRLFRSRRTR
ncbi:MAG: hypothetical protein AUK63_331 [bacterium P3]|nr:MAG: hypothetical protein AUK63_331 [bacterium P3]KWW42709.1 MAG: hypothetical protein F083_113 [bacterium F083]